MGNTASEGVPTSEVTREGAGVERVPVESPVNTDEAALDIPMPITQEPSEAQREPYEWLLPRSGLLPMGGGLVASCPSRLRSICRILSILMLGSGLLVIVGGYVLKYRDVILKWAIAHTTLLIGLGLMVLGVVVQCICASGGLIPGEVPAWDDSVASDFASRRPSRFSLRLWNDSARFGHDVEALDMLLGKTEGRAASQEVLADPDLRRLVKKASRLEMDRQVQRADAARKTLVDRCRSDLEAGISIRRLRQKLEPRCFVLDFSDGDFGKTDSGDAESVTPLRGIQSQIQQLRDAVSFLLTVCTPYDEVVLRVTSPGGLVGDYGLASAQLARVRHAGVHLVACVDVIAASGGYMLACVADKILAAPFALLGSIGVIAGMPNFHRVLQRYEVDYLELTAGKYKRPVSILAKNTEEGITKFQEELNAVHNAFTNHVEKGRGKRIEGGAGSAATGEVFLAPDALARGLVDELLTSDEYLRRRAAEGSIIIEVRAAAQRRNRCQDCCCGACDVIGRAGTHSADAITGVVRSMAHAAFRVGSSFGIGASGSNSSALASHLLTSNAAFAGSCTTSSHASRAEWVARSAVEAPAHLSGMHHESSGISWGLW